MSVQQHLRSAVPASPAGTAGRRSSFVAGRRSSFTASWPTAAAWGAGLVQTALGAGAVVGDDSTLITRAAGVVLVTLGLATLVWGAVSLSRSHLAVPRAALAGATAGVLAMFGLLALAPARTSVVAVAVGTVLLMIVGALCATAVRRGSSPTRDAGGLRGILGLLLAAAVVAVLVTPALGATQDAHLLRDDGTVPAVTHNH